MPLPFYSWGRLTLGRPAPLGAEQSAVVSNIPPFLKSTCPQVDAKFVQHQDPMVFVVHQCFALITHHLYSEFFHEQFHLLMLDRT
jgi:hypothetical protein